MTPRIKTPPTPFSYLDCLRRADETLALPPRWPHVKRVAPKGDLVARFALPLIYAQTSNQRMRGGIKQRMYEARLKQACYDTMRSQNGGRPAKRPLDGRPLVRLVRFSARECDATSDWSKLIADRLTFGKLGLGIIVDDAPKYAEIVTWGEFSSPGMGFVFCDVWTGEAK